MNDRTHRRLLGIATVLLLTACASYSGRGLKPGEARLADVEAVMGPPALRWQAADGSLRLAYPRGPQGMATFMVDIGADGFLTSIDNVLDSAGFAGIHKGMSKDDVLRRLGPSDPAGTVYFAARDELVWDYRYCDDWNEPARFYVLFDGTSGRVRSTMSQTESMRGFNDRRQYCGH